jgi:hypothetical protein
VVSTAIDGKPVFPPKSIGSTLCGFWERAPMASAALERPEKQLE